jgi:flavin-dependent dehydrogenase
MSSAEFAIIGAGPAGAHLASRLAAEGREALLFDPKGAWEKPCGGGVPTRALREFGYFLENSAYPRRVVRRIKMISPVGRTVLLKLDEPFAIFSRKVLNGLVLDRALEAGAQFVNSSVSGFSRVENGWRLTTGCGSTFHARFLIGADGAASPTRRRLAYSRNRISRLLSAITSPRRLLCLLRPARTVVAGLTREWRKSSFSFRAISPDISGRSQGPA